MNIINNFTSCFKPNTYEEKAKKEYNKSMEIFEKNKQREEDFWLEAQQKDLQAFHAKHTKNEEDPRFFK